MKPVNSFRSFLARVGTDMKAETKSTPFRSFLGGYGIYFVLEQVRSYEFHRRMYSAKKEILSQRPEVMTNEGEGAES